MHQFNSRIRYSETDEQGELSLTGIINYLRDCSTFQSEDIRLEVQYLKGSHRTWWLPSQQVMIDRYPRLGKEIVVGTWPYDFRGTYGYRNFTIQDKSGTYLIRVNSIWFSFDTGVGRPARVQEKNVQGYGSGEEKLAMDYAFRRTEVPTEYEIREPVVMARHHLGTNHRVNNAQYVEVVREFLPELRIGGIRVEHKGAAVPGDVIIPHTSRSGKGYIVSLCDKGGSPHTVI